MKQAVPSCRSNSFLPALCYCIHNSLQAKQAFNLTMQHTLVTFCTKIPIEMWLEPAMSVKQYIAYVAAFLARHIQEILKRLTVPAQVATTNLVSHNSACVEL